MKTKSWCYNRPDVGIAAANGMWDKGWIVQSLFFALITLVKIYHARKRIGNRLQRGDCGTLGSMISFFSFSDYWSTLAEAALSLKAALLFPCHDMRQISRNLFQTQEIRYNRIMLCPRNPRSCFTVFGPGHSITPFLWVHVNSFSGSNRTKKLNFQLPKLTLLLICFQSMLPKQFQILSFFCFSFLAFYGILEFLRSGAIHSV